MNPRRDHWTRVATLAVALALGGCAISTTQPVMDAGAAPRGCVVLLHGLARSAGSMSKLEDRLREAGFSVANIDYMSREHPVEALAPDAVGRGLDACRRARAEQVHFVTHSMGGILVRWYLARTPVPELGRVVMLGPPNQGSEIVDKYANAPGFRSFTGLAGRQLGTEPTSLPNQLGPVTYPVGVIAGTGTVNPILSSSIPGEDDGKVAVERTKVAGMADFITLPVSHTFLMRDDEVIRQTLAFLRDGRFDHAAAARR